jgi:hypothetical protein
VKRGGNAFGVDGVELNTQGCCGDLPGENIEDV